MVGAKISQVRQANVGKPTAAVCGSESTKASHQSLECTADGQPKPLDFDAAYGIDLAAVPFVSVHENVSSTPFGIRRAIWLSGLNPNDSATPVYTSYEPPQPPHNPLAVPAVPAWRPPLWLLVIALLLAATCVLAFAAR